MARAEDDVTQEGRVQWTKEDMWNLFLPLSEIIADGVDRFRGSQHGYPGNLASAEEWDAILADIVAGFRVVDELRDGPSMTDESQAKFEKAMALFSAYYLDMWD